MRKLIYIVLIVCMGFAAKTLYAQACCSAGAPILGSLQLSSSNAGNTQLAVSYEYNSLQDVINISNALDDQSRERYTHSLMIEGNYGITKRFSVSGLLTLVQQGRTITTPTGNQNQLVTGGIGDAVLLLNYNLIPGNLFKQRVLNIGVGPKIPLGQSNQRSNGILVPYDMQPGTGAWDAVVWGYFSQGFRPKPFSLFATTAYRLTGQNDLGYEFGNELIASGGLSFFPTPETAFSLLAQYRTVTADQLNNADISNTGGSWLYLSPGFNVNLTESLSLRINGEVPVYRKLNGTQLTTTYRVAFSTHYTF